MTALRADASLKNMKTAVPGEVSLNDIVIRQFELGNPCLPRSLNFYFDFLRGSPVMRAVAYLANSGCAWAEESGGCIMCGTKNFAMHRQVTDDEYHAQLKLIRSEIETYHREHQTQISALYIYNDGLYFNDQEIGAGVRNEIYQLARDMGVKKFSIETSSGDVVRDHQSDGHLRHAVEQLGDVAFEVALGVESTNATLRSLYNKSDTLEDIQEAIKIIRQQGALPKAYLLVKGPLVSEGEAFSDCVNSIRTLRSWEGDPPVRIELQPVCILPNTLHEHLASLEKSDPYYWEPPLMSTVLKILAEFPDAGEFLYSALFAPIDEEQPWTFWRTRPHDCKTTTPLLYSKLAEYYLTRRVEPLKAGLALADAQISTARLNKSIPHKLEERVRVVKKLLELSARDNVYLSDYVRKHVVGDGDFIANSLSYLKNINELPAAEL